MEQVEIAPQAAQTTYDEKDNTTEAQHLEKPRNDDNGVHISKTALADIAANVDDFWVYHDQKLTKRRLAHRL